MVDGDHEDCPACGTRVEGDAWCAGCGIELGGDEAGELRALAAGLAAAESELIVVWARRDRLAKELASRQWRRVTAAGAAPAPPPMPPVPVAHVPAEWNVERVRNLLLWTGATLLALSALAFTAVAWTHLGPAGRALLLVAITIIAATGAVAARRRLPATSGALTGLTIALALIDWHVARRAGVASGLSATAWWAIGTAVVGGASLGLGRVASSRPAHRAVALLGPTSAVLTLVTVVSAAWSGALGLSVLAAVLVAADRRAGGRPVDPVVRALVRIEAGGSWVVGAGLALVAAFAPHTFVQTLTPAAVISTLALAPGLVLVRSESDPADRAPMAVVVILAFVGAALTLASTAIGPVGLVTLAAVLGCVAAVTAPALTELWERAAQVVGVLTVGTGVLIAGSAASIAELGPTAWLNDPWTGAMSATAWRVVSGPGTQAAPLLGWCAVGILASVAVSIPFAFRSADIAPTNAFLARVGAVGAALLSIALLPVAVGASALVASATTTAALVVVVIVSAVAARGRPERALPHGCLAALPAVPAAGWAAMTSTASIAVLAIVVLAALIATLVGSVQSLRAAHAALAAAATVTLAAVVALAAGAAAPASGFVAAATAGALLVLGAQLRRDIADGIACEIVGALGIVIGALVAARSSVWLAGTLTLSVPIFLAAGLRGHRKVEYGIAAGAAAVGATWAWLAAAGVTVVEAYTLPAAVAALTAGSLAGRHGRARSWLNLGPAVVLALGPTLVLAIARRDDTRAITIGVAAVVILLEGARQRLQAPIVLGALTLIALGVDKIGPQAARLPRWAMLAIAGSLLLWVGTTFERRRDDVQRAARGFERLG